MRTLQQCLSGDRRLWQDGPGVKFYPGKDCEGGRMLFVNIGQMKVTFREE